MKSIYRIVGEKHHPGAAEIIRGLKTGAKITLAREPQNKFDKFAVRVYAHVTEHGKDGLRMIGFILGKQVQPLAAHIDKNGVDLLSVTCATDETAALGPFIDCVFVANNGPHVEVEEPDRGEEI